jgi:hypothetical protein
MNCGDGKGNACDCGKKGKEPRVKGVAQTRLTME